MPPRLKIYDEDGKRDIELVYDKVSFGRDARCTIQIRDSMASREHCHIIRQGNDYRLIDLGSRNGTRVNGAPVKEHPLVNGDEVAIGDVVIRFETGGASSKPDSGPGTSGSGRQPRAKRSSSLSRTTRRLPRLPGRRGSDQAALAVVGLVGVLVIVVVLLTVTGPSQTGDDPVALLAQAEQALSAGDIERASQILDRVPGSGLHSSQRLQLGRQLEQAREHAATAARNNEAQIELGSLRDPARQADRSKLVAEYERFIRRFGDLPIADSARRELDALRSTASSSSEASDPVDPVQPHSSEPAAEQPPADTDAAVTWFVERQRYGAAVERLLEAWKKTGEDRFKERMESVLNAGDSAFAAVIKEARALAVAGNLEGARRRLERAGENFGGRYQQRAASEIRQLEGGD
jgi:pyruvate/2-oxoglutarate dehydrogenase complex dihydrolipoamide acyltransferase (E2) component